MKTCTRCHQWLSGSMFHRDRYKLDGIKSWCKKCFNSYLYIRYHANIKHFQMVKRENRRRYRSRHRSEECEKSRFWRQTHPDYARISRRRYYAMHTQEVKISIHRCRKRRRLTDPRFRLKENVSRLICARLRKRLSGKGGKNTFQILPYSLDDLMRRLESKFKLGMSWKNYGEWEIDHIIPDCHFNYARPTDDAFQECWALSNLQPLWGADNLSKGGKI